MARKVDNISNYGQVWQSVFVCVTNRSQLYSIRFVALSVSRRNVIHSASGCNCELSVLPSRTCCVETRKRNVSKWKYGWNRETNR